MNAFVAALFVVGVLSSTCPPKPRQVPHDPPFTKQFEVKNNDATPITKFKLHAEGDSWFPSRPECSVTDSVTGKSVYVREAFAATKGGWGCALVNNLDRPVLVRVQTTSNDDDPANDKTYAYYYFIKKQSRALVNMKSGAGNALVCRLCGVKLVHTQDINNDWTTINQLESQSWDFQCRRRCEATLYKHRNFNGNSMTIASSMPTLASTALENSISSLKIYGKDCEVRVYMKPNYAAPDGSIGGGKGAICSFKAATDIAAWDMDAVRQKCCSKDCDEGQDCFSSIAIRDTRPCGPQSFESSDSNSALSSVCGKDGIRCTVASEKGVVPVSKVASLERLFKAMAEVLED